MQSTKPPPIRSTHSPSQFHDDGDGEYGDGDGVDDPTHHHYHQSLPNDHTITIADTPDPTNSSSNSTGAPGEGNHPASTTTLPTPSTWLRSRRFEYGHYDTDDDEQDDGISRLIGRARDPHPNRNQLLYSSNMSSMNSLINPKVWACIEVAFTLGQAMIAMVMLMSSSPSPSPPPSPPPSSSSPSSSPGTGAELAPLWIWLAGYSMGCIASILLASWKLIISYHRHEQQQQQQVYQSNHTNQQESMIGLHFGDTAVPRPPSYYRVMKVWMRKLGTCLDFFFAVWFVLGNVWVFGRPSLAQQTPRLYRLCVAFLALSCVSYALPFVLCIALCCCLPCFFNMRGTGILDGRLDYYANANASCTGGASASTIAAIPTARFHLELDRWDTNCGTEEGKGEDEDDADADADADGASSAINIGGGFIKSSINHEHSQRHIQAEDALCSICLQRYKENIELRTLPCSHHFHLQCVDQWLRINASCPLCKSSLYPYLGRTLIK